MNYKVHHFEIKMNRDQMRLEKFLNSLSGEVVSIVPNVKPVFMAFWGTAKVDFLLIVERIIG